MHERLTQLLTLLPARDQTLVNPSPDLLDGQLCAALCLQMTEDPVAVLDAHWGEDWAETLAEQELLDEFMTWLEERWQTLGHALDQELLRHDPDALPLAENLPWATERAHEPRSQLEIPVGAREWACGFLKQSSMRGKPSSDEQELLDVVAALLLDDGAALRAYLQKAYDRPQDISASTLMDDALFAAQDLRQLKS